MTIRTMNHTVKNTGIMIILLPLAIIGLQAAAQVNTGSTGTATGSNAPAVTPRPNTVAPIGQYLDSHRDKYRHAIERARTWVDNMAVDPLDLRQHNIKGKKKLAECLDFYVRLYGIAAPEEKGLLLARIKKRVAITEEARYHDLAALNDLQFKEDATSYLRVAFLMDRLGLDTTLYRKEIEKVLPRLNAHMVTRGTDQRMAFHLYYQHFGLTEPFPLNSAFQAGVIAARRDPAGFNNKMDVYSLTHEIFVPYEFGEKLDARFFGEEDKSYLRRTLEYLTGYYIRINDPDIVGELSSCMSYLKFTDLPGYREALSYLLDCQQADGKWGNYESARPFYGDYINQGFYLHTTLVAVDALTTAFQTRPPQ